MSHFVKHRCAETCVELWNKDRPDGMVGHKCPLCGPTIQPADTPFEDGSYYKDETVEEFKARRGGYPSKDRVPERGCVILHFVSQCKRGYVIPLEGACKQRMLPVEPHLIPLSKAEAARLLAESKARVLG